MNHIDMYMRFLKEYGLDEGLVHTYSPWKSPYVNDTRKGVKITMRNGATIIYIPY